MLMTLLIVMFVFVFRFNAGETCSSKIFSVPEHSSGGDCASSSITEHHSICCQHRDLPAVHTPSQQTICTTPMSHFQGPGSCVLPLPGQDGPEWGDGGRRDPREEPEPGAQPAPTLPGPGPGCQLHRRRDHDVIIPRHREHRCPKDKEHRARSPRLVD